MKCLFKVPPTRNGSFGESSTLNKCSFWNFILVSLEINPSKAHVCSTGA